MDEEDFIKAFTDVPSVQVRNSLHVNEVSIDSAAVMFDRSVRSLILCFIDLLHTRPGG